MPRSNQWKFWDAFKDIQNLHLVPEPLQCACAMTRSACCASQVKDLHRGLGSIARVPDCASTLFLKTGHLSDLQLEVGDEQAQKDTSAKPNELSVQRPEHSICDGIEREVLMKRESVRLDATVHDPIVGIG